MLSVERFETGCRVTALREGAAVVRAAVPLAGVTIAAIHGEDGEPVDLTDVSGTVEVVVNVIPGSRTVTRVELRIADADGENPIAVASEDVELTAPQGEGAGTHGPEAHRVTLSANTAARDVDEETGAETPRHPNGPRQFQAHGFVEGGEEPWVTNTIVVTLDNL